MRWSRKATSSASTFFTRATHSRSILSFEMRGTGFPAMRGSTTGMVFSLVTCRLPQLLPRQIKSSTPAYLARQCKSDIIGKRDPDHGPRGIFVGHGFRKPKCLGHDPRE